MATPRNVTALLDDWSRGNRSAFNQLLPLVYSELRRIAARQLRSERTNHTLQPTALVHEVYLRLVDQRQVDWQSRAHFFGVAVDSTAKRGAEPVVANDRAHYGEIARSTGGFFFVWTLWALGGLGGVTFILSTRGLWSLRRGHPR